MAILTKGNIKKTLLNMSLPLLAGTFAMNAYNLTDTWFVSQLGKDSLAAMSFTFPVVMLVSSLAMGLGSGITALVSHAIGESKHEKASRIATHGLMMMTALTVIMSILGFLCVDKIFTLLGADATSMPLIRQYMNIWFMGSITITLPLIGNGLLISCGDSKGASRIMMIGTIINTILDPILIFGWLGLPALGIRGAAIATVIGQATSTIWMLMKLNNPHRLLERAGNILRGALDSCKHILQFGVPSILSAIMMPLSSAVLTRIISSYGNEAVAATGAASRIEMFAFMITMTVGISLSPFVSQNYGAKEFKRILDAIKYTAIFALSFGFLVAAAFFVSAPLLASLFTKDPKVSEVLILYIRTISFGYGLMEVHRFSTMIMTGMHKPTFSLLLNAMRVLVLLIPLSYFGGQLWEIKGVFIGRLITDVSAGLIGFICIWNHVRSVSSNHAIQLLDPQDNLT